MFEGLRKPEELIVLVVTLLAYGCPPQAIVHALGLDEPTVARWQERAGAHCHKVHEDQVAQAKLALLHVQVDELRVKGCQMIPWMALALMVSTRLWVGGVLSLKRDQHLAARVIRMGKTCCQPLQALLVVTDGCSAYPGSIQRAFREKGKRTAGRGRSKLVAWPQVGIGTVIKRTKNKHVVEVIRRVTQGTAQRLASLVQASRGGSDLNTAFIERFHGTMRERLASRARRCRHATGRLTTLEAGMWLVACTYNFCWPHHQLSRNAAKAQGKKGEVPITPALASRLTDHIWSVEELLSYRVAPPPWVAPKRRGRPPKAAERSSRQPECARPRPLLRLRKGALCPSTS